MVGLVTSLHAEKKEAETTDDCATWGVVTVESGYIASPKNPNRGVVSIVGKQIAFHRSVFWVFGRSTRKAVDLAMLLQKKAKVILEGREITEEEKEKYKSWLPKGVNHIATIVYIGSTRPRNENSINVNLNDAPAIEAWQNKRHLSPANLNNLLEGEELGPSCGDKWEAKRDKDGFKLPEEPNKAAGNKGEKGKGGAFGIGSLANPFERQSLLGFQARPPVPGLMGLGRG